MIALSAEGSLLLVWVAFAAMALAGAIAVLVWAVRSGQFADQDRARHLPLTSGIPAEPPAAEGGSSDVRP